MDYYLRSKNTIQKRRLQGNIIPNSHLIRNLLILLKSVELRRNLKGSGTSPSLEILSLVAVCLFSSLDIQLSESIKILYFEI